MKNIEKIQLHKHILMLWDKSVNGASGFYAGNNCEYPVTASRINQIGLSRGIDVKGIRKGKIEINTILP